MSDVFVRHQNVSVVSAIIAPEIAHDVIDAIFALGDMTALQVNARGTLMRNRWYQALIPMVSPELEYLQFLVPDREVDRVIETLVTEAGLHRPGAGTVFAVPCNELTCSEDFHLWSNSTWEDDDYNASHDFQENLTAIQCILQPEQTDSVARAAMSAGTHGPVVFFSEGRGLRDRLGWLKITKKRDKEVLLVIVDNADAIAVTEAMVDAGNIDQPGRGFLFRLPVQKGIVKLGSTIGRNKYAANMQQVIAAIDQLQGSTAWRTQQVDELVGTGKTAGVGLFGKVRPRAYLAAQGVLTCLVARKNSDLVVEAALDGGAPGANVTYARLIEADTGDIARGIRINRERGIIRMILPEDQMADVARHIQNVGVEQGIGDICLYTQPVTRAITYIADAGQRNDVVIGARPRTRPQE